MNDPTARAPSASQSKSKRGRYGCVFFFCLFFLGIGITPPLHDLPGLQARFTGRETTTHITADGSCSWEEANGTGGETVFNGYYYVYTYTASSGKVYRIHDANCSNSDTLGASEVIWYQPADPTHFITANAWTFDWIFFLGFAIPMLLFAFVCFRRLFTPLRRFTEVQRG